MPRLALLLFCVAYVLPGWFGREPWKSADMAAFGYMQALADGRTAWLDPTLLGMAPEQPGLLPLWLGAASISLFGGWLPADFAVRIPFGLMLGGTLMATWYCCFYLARRASAQPVTFAFGGEAQPADYARAVSDGALLALIASLGMAQLSHQTTLDVAQLFFVSLMLWGFAALPRVPLAAAVVSIAAPALALSGAPSLALIACVLGGLSQHASLQLDARAHASELAALQAYALESDASLHAWRSSTVWLWTTVVFAAAAVIFATLSWGEFRNNLRLPANLRDWRDTGRLWLWFAWPSALLAAWTLWRWRAHLLQGHLLLPLGAALTCVGLSALSHNADRAMLLALPALAVLAAFALPTVSRSLASLIDWFTLLFFSGCAIVIWVVWLAMHTGVPAQPAANVARLAPGFVAEFNAFALLCAVSATVAWAGLVRWRVGRNRHAIWKSLVLPAGGAALCWLLLMTLWLPLLDFARSYAPLMRKVSSEMTEKGCVQTFGFTRAQIAAVHWYTGREVRRSSTIPECPYLLVDADSKDRVSIEIDLRLWSQRATVRRPADDDEDLVIYQRSP